MSKTIEEAQFAQTYENGTILIDTYRIRKCYDASGTQFGRDMEYTCECGIRVEYTNDNGFEGDMLFFGKHDEANKSQKPYTDAIRFLARVNGKAEIDDDGYFLPEVLASTEGKDFKVVKYVYSQYRDKTTTEPKLGYKEWTKVFAVNHDENAMVEEFLLNVKRGYPRDYKPELMEEYKLLKENFKGVPSNAPATKSTYTPPSAKPVDDIPDDDLPF